MSHYVNIKTSIKELTALAAAVAELGGKIVFRQPGKEEIEIPGSDAVITFPGLDYYSVSVKRQADGTYQLSGDEDIFRSKLPNGQTMGHGYGAIVQLYGVHNTMMQARKLGHAVSRVAGVGGKINVVITGRM